MQEYLLYPVLGPARDDLVRLALFLPALRVVGFPGRPGYDLPGGLMENVSLVEPDLEPKLLDLFGKAEASYRSIARVFDDAASLANLKGQLWMEGPLEGEFQILGEIRGGAKAFSEEEKKLVESLVFLRLAEEYDLAQSEVDQDLAELTSLEEMLKESLGPDADLPEPAPDPPSTDEDLLAPIRFRAYLRLLALTEGVRDAAGLVCPRESYHQAVLSAAGADLLEEEPETVTIATLPDPAGLSDANIELFLNASEQTGVLKRFKDAVSAVFDSLAESGEPDQEPLDAAAAISGELATVVPLASQRAEIDLIAALLPFADPVGLLSHLFLRGEKPPPGRSCFVSLAPAPPRQTPSFGPSRV